jgi:putative hydrolase of HD superfamily
LATDPGTVITPKISEPWAVEKVLATIQPAPPAEGTSSPVPFFHVLERLKTGKREGWRRFGVNRYGPVQAQALCAPTREGTILTWAFVRGESIADHMYRMSLMTLLCPPALAAKIDITKCMKMCLIHDMAEAIVGDITPVDGVAKPEKSRREAETMDYITKNLLGGVHGGIAGKEIREIWQEYEDSKTLDSHFVHDIDKMELLCQMIEYEKRAGRNLDLGEFAYVSTKMVLPETQAWAKEILAEREEFWGDKEHFHGEEFWSKKEREEGEGMPAGRFAQQDAYYDNTETNGTKP